MLYSTELRGKMLARRVASPDFGGLRFTPDSLNPYIDIRATGHYSQTLASVHIEEA